MSHRMVLYFTKIFLTGPGKHLTLYVVCKSVVPRFAVWDIRGLAKQSSIAAHSNAHVDEPVRL